MGWRQISPYYGQNVAVVGPSGSSAAYIGARGIQGAVESIKDASATKLYNVVLMPGTYTPGASAADELRLDGLVNATKKYINLMGEDRDACIISRPASPGVGNSIIVSSDFCRISNLTLDSPVSRALHVDRTQGSQVTIDNVHFRQGGSGVGISAGVTGAGSRIEVTKCLFNADFSVHITSTTSAQAGVNNAQVDPTRILGWAYTAKSGGSSGRVVVKLNRAINCW